MVKETNKRITVTLPKKMIELLELRGNVSKQIKKAIIRALNENTPSYYELAKIGIDYDKDNVYEELGFYD